MPYFNIEVKQLISDKTDNFEVVFNPGGDQEFTEDIAFFALCDLRECACLGETEEGLEDCIGVILPVLFSCDDGLAPVLLSLYKHPDEQEVQLIKKGEPKQ